MAPNAPPDILIETRRIIDHISGFTLTEDLTWNSAVNCWTIEIEYEPKLNSEFIPKSTKWIVVFINKLEPGHCEFYPAKNGGITATFPHQSVNAEGPPERRWRSGNPCIDAPSHILGKREVTPEPHDPRERFHWRLRRLAEWIETAAADALIRDGDAFELPALDSAQVTLAFKEDSHSFTEWGAEEARWGYVQLASFQNNDDVLIALEFQNYSGEAVCMPPWGSIRKGLILKHRKALWLRLPSVPVRDPWDSQITWGDIINFFEEDGSNFTEVLTSWLSILRKSPRHHLAIGYPIPEVAGGPNVQMHWQLASLPGFPSKTPKGFRKNPSSLIKYYSSCALRPTSKVPWADSENWSTDELTTRGTFSERLKESKIAIVGLGAIGSFVSEFFVRGGIQELFLVDADSVKGGNVSRHTLTLGEVGFKKAEALKKRLLRISAQANIYYASKSFSKLTNEQIERLHSADVIIDASGSDRLLEQFSRFDWKRPRLFFSCSMGLHGDQVYCLACNCQKFPASELLDRIRPYVEADWKDVSDTDLPRGHVGCWHPVFPVRVDNINQAASLFCRFVEENTSLADGETKVTVFSVEYVDGRFQGIERQDVDTSGTILSVVG